MLGFALPVGHIRRSGNAFPRASEGSSLASGQASAAVDVARAKVLRDLGEHAAADRLMKPHLGIPTNS